MNKKIIARIRKAAQILNFLKIGYTMDDLGTEILLQPRTPAKENHKYDGMQMIYDTSTGIFEVSEYQAGPRKELDGFEALDFTEYMKHVAKRTIELQGEPFTD